MKEIPLTKGYVTSVDDDVYEELNKHLWRLADYGKHLYAIRWSPMVNRKRHLIYMHRQLLGLSSGDNSVVDHRDSDGLNNLKSNLRICSQKENTRNRSIQPHSSIYKGVSWSIKQGKYKSGIKYNDKSIHLGSFSDEVEAAKAYDKKALELFGAYAKTNFQYAETIFDDNGNLLAWEPDKE